jgi:NADH-quinone oxidoreductase subunit L
MLMLVLADNLLMLYFAWELVGLCSYLLIGFWWERRSAAEAAKKAFITTRIGDVGLLIGILLLAAETGTFDITTILGLVSDPEAGLSNMVVTLSAFLIFFGAMGKSAQFPLHVWLPDAMEGPSPVSALIHAATMVTAGVFLVARLLPLYEAVSSAQLTIAIVGIITALMGAGMALVATDLKRILAFSTMSHLGFMMLALGAGGLVPAIFHLLMHGVAKAMLFLGAGSIMHSMHEETDIRKMGGLRRRMPVTAATFTIGALALSGIAPLSGFWSKDEILLVVKDELSPVFLVLFLFAAVLSALYMIRAVYLVFFGTLKADNRDVQESPPIMALPVALLGLLTLVIGFIALPLGGNYEGFGSFLYEAAVTPWEAAAHGPHEFEFNALWAAVGTGLAVGGLLLGLWLYAKRQSAVVGIRERFAFPHRVLVERFFMDRAYQWLINNVVLLAGRGIAFVDRVVVNDIGVNGTGWSVMQSSKKLRLHVTGLFADYGLAMAAGSGAIAVFFWLRT